MSTSPPPPAASAPVEPSASPAQRWWRTESGRQMVATVVSTVSVLLIAVGLFLTNAANRAQEKLTEQGQVTDRFARAIDQLGSDKLDVRLGGVYLLDRLMRDSPADEGNIVEVLSAFIRDHAPITAPAQAHPTTDVQAALTVLGRRRYEAYIDLTETNLSHADITAVSLDFVDLTGANLTGALFSGASLRYANLTDANLTGASLTLVGLAYARLYRADLTRAEFYGVELDNAKGLTSKQVQCTFMDADTRLPAGVSRPIPDAPVKNPACRTP